VLHHDVIYTSNFSCFNAIRHVQTKQTIRKSGKWISALRGEKEWPAVKDQIMWPRAVMCVSPRIMNKVKRDCPHARLVYVPNGCDCQFWRRTPKAHTGFIVGWAGNPQHTDFDGSPTAKRTYLLKRLGFPLRLMAQYGRKYFVHNRSRQPMLDFYNSIDAYVQVSKHEGLPLPINEAMSCELPVVSTAVGDIPSVVSKDWLVPSNPDALVVQKVKKKLSRLAANEKLRRKVGVANRQRLFETGKCWPKAIKGYEAVWSLVLKR